MDEIDKSLRNTVSDIAIDQPEVAIVILNWNGVKFLEKFLPSVLQSSYTRKRVIVADNASTDNSVLFIRNTFPAVELIVNSTNEGFAKGYNTALSQIKSDYYVLLNSDVEVSANWIEPVIQLMESDTMIAACQPKILSYNDKTHFEYAGASGGWMDSLGYPFMRGRIFDICEEDKGQYDNVTECFWASGACFFVKAEIYHQSGGLDAYFFAHQEEIDLCWRLKRKGYKIMIQPASVVYHVGGGTLPKGNSRKTYLNFRNNLIMMHKNLSVADALWKIPARILLNFVAAIKSFLDGDSGYSKAVFAAHKGYFSWLVKAPKQKTSGKLLQFSGWYHGLIIWEHFIKKRNFFSQIVKGK